MSYEDTLVGKLLASDINAAASEVVRLIERSNGNLVHAALLAGVHHSTFKRWVARLDLAHGIREKLSEIRATSVPDKLPPATREILTAKAAEARRIATLRRVAMRLVKQPLKLEVVEQGLPAGSIASWLESPSSLGRLSRRVESVLEAHRGVRR